MQSIKFTKLKVHEYKKTRDGFTQRKRAENMGPLVKLFNCNYCAIHCEDNVIIYADTYTFFKCISSFT